MIQKKYNDYLQILREELVPAMECTESIAIAYTAADDSALVEIKYAHNNI